MFSHLEDDEEVVQPTHGAIPKREHEPQKREVKAALA